MDSFEEIQHITRLEPYPDEDERSAKFQKTKPLYDLMRPHLSKLSDLDSACSQPNITAEHMGQMLFGDDNGDSYEYALGMSSATAEHPIYMRSQIESNQNAGFGGPRPDFRDRPL